MKMNPGVFRKLCNHWHLGSAFAAHCWFSTSSSSFEFVLHTCLDSGPGKNMGFLLVTSVWSCRDGRDDGLDNAVEPHLVSSVVLRWLYKGPSPPSISLIIQPAISLPINQHSQSTLKLVNRTLNPTPTTNQHAVLHPRRCGLRCCCHRQSL